MESASRLGLENAEKGVNYNRCSTASRPGDTAETLEVSAVQAITVDPSFTLVCRENIMNPSFTAPATATRRRSCLGALAFTLALALTSPPAFAASKASIVVEGVQMPAWVERGGDRPVPLSPGMEISRN